MELGLQKHLKRGSDEENDTFVVNAAFQSRSTDNAEDTTGQCFVRRPSSASSGGEESSSRTAPAPGFFRNGHKHSQLDPKSIASRPSDQMMQDQRLLGHQVLYRDRVFSDAGLCPTTLQLAVIPDRMKSLSLPL